ncbi:uncharacterized protein LOC110032349 isoform X2 [Phalaenopsis equestris]|uniref:uncharacterized protein LOC110032349 isoform X2 n=1 Tax=Phalaenopsis equestris TaxID=78828 RepID=UPI0009E39BF7|nr:uncharacterized protein LOC110032349 isoform X2 [Phalaenopsis equestris]
MASIPPAVWVSVPTPLPSPSSIASSYGPNIFSLLPRRLKSRRAISASSSEDGASAGEIEISDRVRLAFSKANAYRKENTSSPQALVNAKKPFMDPAIEVRGSGGSEPEVPIAVNLNMEKSRENKKNREVSVEEPRDPGVEEKSLRGSRKGPVDSKLDKKAVLKISSKDFLGLDFSEKESHRRRPPGLVPLVGPLVEGDVQEVEIIVGDASKFEKTPRASTSFEVVDNTFGGGRTFVPGEMLETLETKKAKEKCSRELIYAYKRKMGLVVDAKARAECEKALKEGDSLMDQGQLRGALPYYEKVMKLLVFQSDLHGLAALQWSICLDSLSRPNEARFMYEKLKSHPNAEVSKKARQFVFSFQAMEMMKVKNTNVPIKTGYEDYFEALVNNQVSYTPSIEEQNERVLEQVFPYIVFLLSPMLIILYVIVKKSL